MPTDLSEAQRAELGDRAILAIRAHLAAALADAGARAAAGEIAQLAVTDAVARAGIPHTYLAEQAGCYSLYVADLITDPRAQARALRAEREAATRHNQSLRASLYRYAAGRVATRDRGAVTQAARDLGASRKTVYQWAGAEVPAGDDD